MWWKLVFNHDERMWFGTLSNSEKEARRCGYEYMRFNGAIWRLMPDGDLIQTALYAEDIVYEIV